jgi:hypothetical protein
VFSPVTLLSYILKNFSPAAQTSFAFGVSSTESLSPLSLSADAHDFSEHL